MQRKINVGSWVAILPAPAEFGVVSSVCYAPNNERIEELVITCVTGNTWVIGSNELKTVLLLKKPDGLKLIKAVLK